MPPHCKHGHHHCRWCIDKLTTRSEVKVVHKSKPLTRCDIQKQSEADYDVIIVGAGTSGSLLAYRFATELPQLKIAVIEAGQDDQRAGSAGFDAIPAGYTNPTTFNPATPGDSDWGIQIRDSFNYISMFGDGAESWQYNATAADSIQPVRPPILSLKASTWGGTSEHNAAYWFRGTKAGTWDRMESVLGAEWGYQKIVESYKKIENRSQIESFSQQRMYTPGVDNAFNTLNPVYYSDEPSNRIAISGSLLSGNTPMYAGLETALENVFPGRFHFGKSMDDPALTNDEFYATQTFSWYQQGDPSFFADATGDVNPFSNPVAPGPVNFVGLDGRFASLSEKQLWILSQPPFNVPPQFHFKRPVGRCGGAPAFLYPIVDLPNVTIISRAFATKLLTDANACRVTGVEYMEDGWNVNLIGRTKNLRGTTLPGASAADAVTNRANAVIKQITARADVIVCGGVVDAPALLQRSGIGRRSHLEGIGVDVKLDLPGVGFDILDRYEFDIVYDSDLDQDYPAVPTSITGYYLGLQCTNPALPNFISPAICKLPPGLAGTMYNFPELKLKSDPSKQFANFNLSFLPSFSGPATGGRTTTTVNGINDWAFVSTANTNVNPGAPESLDFYGDGETFFPPISVKSYNYIYCQQNETRSRGTCLISTPDPTVPPVFKSGLLDSPEDIDDMVNLFQNTLLPLFETDGGLKDQDQFISDPTDPLNSVIAGGPGKHFKELIAPAPSDYQNADGSFNRNKFVDYLKRHYNSSYLTVGGCKMGKPTDPNAVCDNLGRVYNIKALRVSSAAAFPIDPDGVTQAPCYVIAQRLFELMKPEYIELFQL